VLDQHLDVAAALHQWLGGAVQVALAVRRVLEELAVAGEVALRRRDVAVRLDRVEPQRGAVRRRRHPPVRGRPRDHHVVTGVDLEMAEDRLDGGRAALDVDHLVADGVAVER
jgi:hypothetical protein